MKHSNSSGQCCGNGESSKYLAGGDLSVENLANNLVAHLSRDPKSPSYSIFRCPLVLMIIPMPRAREGWSKISTCSSHSDILFYLFFESRFVQGNTHSIDKSVGRPTRALQYFKNIY